MIKDTSLNEYEIDICSISGEILMRRNTSQHEISLRDLEKGVYVAIISNGQSKQIIKFITY